MNDFLPPGYSSFEEPVTHRDLGTSNSSYGSAGVNYFTSRDPRIQERINKKREEKHD